jgi:outer membrane immunogenic protein
MARRALFLPHAHMLINVPTTLRLGIRVEKIRIVALGLALTAAGPALASELSPATSAAPLASAAVTDWSGFYLDGDAAWLRKSYTWNTDDAAGPNFNSTFGLANSEVGLGGHLGYQRQFGWLVVGGEAGIFTSFGDRFASVTSPGTGAGLTCGLAFPGQMCQARIGAVLTYGGKLGVAWSDWLLYGVGGGAAGGLRSQINLVGAGLAPGLADYTPSANANGWYVGGGVDYMLFKGKPFDVIVGVEYEHVELGAVQEYSSNNGFGPGYDQRALSAKVDTVLGKVTVKF